MSEVPLASCASARSLCGLTIVDGRHFTLTEREGEVSTVRGT